MPKRARSKGSQRALLQDELGDIGEVLPRVPRGGASYPAAGWYCEIGDERVYLGDHVTVALVTIGRLLEAEPA